MKSTPTLPSLLQRFFTERLMRQRQASPHTIACYRDSFRLLLQFAEQTLHKQPSDLDLSDIDAKLVDGFLDHLQKHRSVSRRTSNLRLTAIRSFFRFAAFTDPARSAHVQSVLAIPAKRQSKSVVQFLRRPEIEAILAAPDRGTWIGRRDHALILLGAQTGLRLSELTALERQSVVLERGAHVRCHGKGRKERVTPLTDSTVKTLKSWMKEPPRKSTSILFPSSSGARLSADTVQYLLAKYVKVAGENCPSLKRKRVTVHSLRHSAAMELLEAGVDSTVIALWLGHESIQTTQVYIHAHMALKEAALARTAPLNTTPGRYRPPDSLLEYLGSL